ncbi:MAG: GGDEF domain-containing protein [Actinobacteria bacterium]|nr:MAG: GGDEF domain-containing protein [Actinomycetota bacterium]
MSDASGTVTGSSNPAATDPLARIAETVRRLMPGPAGDELLAQIADILASVVPDDIEQVALENAQLQHELELVQSVDSLTGLRNRQRFFEDLRREVAAARRYNDSLSLVVLDVDGLRAVNETRGYDAGDRLLLTLGELLLTRLRVTDIAARIGDDDFAVILPRTPLVGAEALSVRIGDTLGDWVDIGIATLDAGVTSGADLLERADRDLAERRAARDRSPAA